MSVNNDNLVEFFSFNMISQCTTKKLELATEALEVVEKEMVVMD